GENTVRVEYRAPLPLEIGDHVSVVGFVDMRRLIAGINGATVQKLGRGQLPPPTQITPSAILAINAAAVQHGQQARPRDFDGTQIEFAGTLVAVSRPEGDDDNWRKLTVAEGETLCDLLIQQGDVSFVDALLVGSELRVRGTAQL